MIMLLCKMFMVFTIQTRYTGMLYRRILAQLLPLHSVVLLRDKKTSVFNKPSFDCLILFCYLQKHYFTMKEATAMAGKLTTPEFKRRVVSNNEGHKKTTSQEVSISAVDDFFIIHKRELIYTRLKWSPKESITIWKIEYKRFWEWKCGKMTCWVSASL